eukprot:scaffold443_cov234-Pinguiococcus_pyrenoidosus.AAC.1
MQVELLGPATFARSQLVPPALRGTGRDDRSGHVDGRLDWFRRMPFAAAERWGRHARRGLCRRDQQGGRGPDWRHAVSGERPARRARLVPPAAERRVQAVPVPAVGGPDRSVHHAGEQAPGGPLRVVALLPGDGRPAHRPDQPGEHVHGADRARRHVLSLLPRPVRGGQQTRAVLAGRPLDEGAALSHLRAAHADADQVQQAAVGVPERTARGPLWLHRRVLYALQGAAQSLVRDQGASSQALGASAHRSRSSRHARPERGRWGRASHAEADAGADEGAHDPTDRLRRDVRPFCRAEPLPAGRARAQEEQRLLPQAEDAGLWHLLRLRLGLHAPCRAGDRRARGLHLAESVPQRLHVLRDGSAGQRRLQQPRHRDRLPRRRGTPPVHAVLRAPLRAAGLPVLLDCGVLAVGAERRPAGLLGEGGHAGGLHREHLPLRRLHAAAWVPHEGRALHGHAPAGARQGVCARAGKPGGQRPRACVKRRALAARGGVAAVLG